MRTAELPQTKGQCGICLHSSTHDKQPTVQGKHGAVFLDGPATACSMPDCQCVRFVPINTVTDDASIKGDAEPDIKT